MKQYTPQVSYVGLVTNPENSIFSVLMLFISSCKCYIRPIICILFLLLSVSFTLCFDVEQWPQLSLNQQVGYLFAEHVCPRAVVRCWLGELAACFHPHLFYYFRLDC